MIFAALPGVTDCFTLVAFEPERHLVLGWRPNDSLVMTWAFVLNDVTSRSCRLVVRAREGTGYHFHALPRWLTSRLGPVVHFIMQRKQLLGIKGRAESTPARMFAPTDLPRTAESMQYEPPWSCDATRSWSAVAEPSQLV
jgi:hypothetical protein